MKPDYQYTHIADSFAQIGALILPCQMGMIKRNGRSIILEVEGQIRWQSSPASTLEWVWFYSHIFLRNL